MISMICSDTFGETGTVILYMNVPRGFRFLFEENEVSGDFLFEIDSSALGALSI